MAPRTMLRALPLLLGAAAALHTAGRAPALAPAEGRKGKLAVVICGLQDRLLWHSKLDRLVRPLAAAGHTVDLYVEVIASEAERTKIGFSKLVGQVKSPDSDVPNLASALDGNATAAGGRVAYFHTRASKEQVPLPQGRAARRLPKRLSKYPPTTDPVGRNVLRRYQTAERLMNLVSASGVQYDFVLWTRDDDYWLGPLDLAAFLAERQSPMRVYSKNCLNWGGINDKTLLFGGKAAEAMLGRIFSDFWLRDPRLEGTNAESFLRAFAEMKGVESVPVPFSQLPTADSVYVQTAQDAGPRLCQKDQYLCAGLPASGDFERPLPCGQLEADLIVAGSGSPTAAAAATVKTEAAATAPSPSPRRLPKLLAVVNYWSYADDEEKRKSRSAALVRTLQALAAYPLPVRSLLVTNAWAPEAEGLVSEQVVRSEQRCSPTLTDPLCMAWEAMRVLRNESTGGPANCDLFRHAACGELQYDYFLYLEGDIEMTAATFEFWARHVDGLFKQGYVLVPHREEPYNGKRKLVECVRNQMVDHLAKTKAMRDPTVEAAYKAAGDRVYLQPPVPYSACLAMSRWQFEIFRTGSAWDYEAAARVMKGGKVREAAIKGLLGDPRMTKLKALTHVKVPVLHQERMTGAEGLYPDMCNVEDYKAKSEECAAQGASCPSL